MKNVLLVVCALLFVSVAGFAEPGPAPLSSEALAAILGLPVDSGACPAPLNGVPAAKKPANGLLKALCTATATCEFGTVYCEGNNSTASCTAVDRNCGVGQRGYVTCDGVTTWCPTICDDECTDSPPCCRCADTGDCISCCRCDGGSFLTCDRACNGGF